MDNDNQKDAEPVQEAEFWQSYLENEDAELDRLNNAVWPEEIAIGIGVLLLVGAAIYYLFG